MDDRAALHLVGRFDALCCVCVCVVFVLFFFSEDQCYDVKLGFS